MRSACASIAAGRMDQSHGGGGQRRGSGWNRRFAQGVGRRRRKLETNVLIPSYEAGDVKRRARTWRSDDGFSLLSELRSFCCGPFN